MKIVTFSAPEELYAFAHRRIETLAEEAVRDRGRFTAALSGGSTPLPLYRLLAQSARMPWDSVHLFWSDERCVPPDDPESNYAAAKRMLLDSARIPDDHVHRIPGEDSPTDAADAYQVTLRRVLGENGRLDLVLLGAGADGHTASLFPEHAALEETDRWVLPVHVSTASAWRVSMTLPAINAARDVLILVVGREKRELLKRIERGEDLPVSRVCPTRGRLAWLVAVS